jgi:branched-chain amino acid transport system permease protein
MSADSLAVPAEPASSRASLGPWVARGAVWLAIAAVVLVLPLRLPEFHAARWSLAAIYAIVALSLNVLIGHAGQLSLGHQGFFGVGAMVSAYVVSVHAQEFWIGLLVAAVSGAAASALMGMVALRVRGLYLALVTLVYGRMAEASIFTLPVFGSGAGVEAPRPQGFEGQRSWYYLCLVALLLVWYLDWRFTTSKAGRAVQAVRSNEQVAASYAVPVARYKLLAFVLSGVMVGIAGSLFAHLNRRVDPQTFDFSLALFFVIVTVVGGLRSRPGVVLFAVALTLVPEYWSSGSSPFISQALSALLLVAVLVFAPGGVGQLIRPVTRWLAGGPFERNQRERFVEEGGRDRP